MAREEEIIKAGIDYSIQNSPLCIGRDKFYEQVSGLNRNKSFEAGAKWADKTHENPWISVKDDLPCNHEELTPKDYTVEVLTLDDCNSYRVVRMWEFDGKWIWSLDDLPITHWMRLPELPKE